ncbi:hypothetical protein L914_21136 [Phytophthora nicotianae]|uniref:Reverse transcriptase RNase H-like domain-containing protein n=1 Tax=Phytophthora nicotianae TaxID=4792 RepID=W2M6U9_PHYNI|nr:hypothetical protein L914_21136 [Phytophthora nicotianae]
MTLDVQHHIGIGKEALIMLKRWQQAETKDAIVANVAQTLRADFIEESNDAWGFPVVLVRMKVGEVRFCVDNRASEIGLGVCLMQDVRRGWQPVAYASKLNNDAERDTLLRSWNIWLWRRVAQTAPIWADRHYRTIRRLNDS